MPMFFLKWSGTTPGRPGREETVLESEPSGLFLEPGILSKEENRSGISYGSHRGVPERTPTTLACFSEFPRCPYNNVDLSRSPGRLLSVCREPSRVGALPRLDSRFTRKPERPLSHCAQIQNSYEAANVPLVTTSSNLEVGDNWPHEKVPGCNLHPLTGSFTAQRGRCVSKPTSRHNTAHLGKQYKRTGNFRVSIQSHLHVEQAGGIDLTVPEGQAAPRSQLVWSRGELPCGRPPAPPTWSGRGLLVPSCRPLHHAHRTGQGERGKGSWGQGQELPQIEEHVGLLVQNHLDVAGMDQRIVHLVPLSIACL